ncbi:MAG TPA: membrane protein insertase YidC [Caulobacteraceae bacterium]|jgi:YidC/Oxa1 family membrane protein insertase
MKQDPSTRNTIIFFVCAMALLFAYETFVMGPAEKRQAEQRKAQQALQEKMHPGVPLIPGAAPQVQYLTRDKALAASPRVQIDTAALQGSIDLKGGRIDDLFLKGYRENLAKNAPNVELLRPDGTAGAYFVQTGWEQQTGAAIPDANAIWTAPDGARLTTSTPVTLTYAAPTGLVFARTIAVDDKFVFTVTDKVTNNSGAPVSLAAYSSVQRQCAALDATHKDPCLPDGATRINAHEGSIGWLNGALHERKYGDWLKKGAAPESFTGAGWLGITDRYWMTALAPPANQPATGSFRVTPSIGYNVFEADVVGPTQALAPGASAANTTHAFAGAKVVPVLQGYEKTLGIPQFDRAIDWGLFSFLTHPLFVVLEFFYQHVGNFGIAILLLTVCVRALFFPLANKSFESATRMKKVQPQVESLKKKFDKDPQKQQQEMMALYQREKINPLGGCLPMLFQVPVFFALYKVLSINIEMRQAPFFGWIHDLSQRDPTTIMNLFGALPFDPSLVPVLGGVFGTYLHIGVWPLVYMVTMFLSMSMTPTTGMDPAQQQVMRLMPILFSFFITNVAVGLVIYWCWSNCLSILQQYLIMHRLKVDNPIDAIIRKVGGKAPAT